MRLILKLYDKAIVAITNELNKNRTTSVTMIVMLSIFYLLDLFGQVNQFIKSNGDWTSPDFLTQRTVVPWILFVLMGLFTGPFLAAALFLKPRLDLINGEVSRSYEASRAIPIFLTVAMFFVTPYGIITVASYVRNCSGEELAICRRIQNGEAPAVVFQTTNINDITQQLVKCGRCLDIDTTQLQKAVKKQ